MTSLPDPLPLRAHAVLCLLGFRGKGYSEAFVREMTTVAAALRRDDDLLIQLQDGPGTLCAACPHLEGGCTLGGEDHEPHMVAHDREVLRRLGFEAGDVVSWSQVKQRIAQRIRGSDLDAICTTCPWLELGHCAEGVDALGRDERA